MLPLVELYPEIILDKVVNGGCSKRRPDGLIDMHTHSIIIEIDEDQHSGYESLCDNRRTMELFQDLGNRPIIFIRLNPDSYKINIKRHNSVFKLDKNSNELVKNTKEFNYRFQLLTDAINTAINTIPTKNVSYVKICYTD